VICLVFAISCAGGWGAGPPNPTRAHDPCHDLVARYRTSDDVIERNQMYSDADESCQKAMLGDAGVPSRRPAGGSVGVVAGAVLGTLASFALAAAVSR